MLVQRKRMRRGEGRGVVAEGLGRCGGVGEKDEGGVCLPVKKTRRGERCGSEILRWQNY